MTSFFDALHTNPLLLAAILAGIAASFVSGIIGSYVVVKRIIFICGSISHAVLSGIGICLWLERAKGFVGVSPLLGALIAAIVSSLLIGWIHLHYRQREDTVIAAIWSIGMAVGILFISQTPGFNVELTNFLIGNILWVTPTDLKILLTLDIVIFLTVLCLHKRFLAICFDEEQAQLQGISVNSLYLLLLVLTAVSIVLLIQVVGIILVMTMLTIPAAIANLFTTRLSQMMAIAICISAGFCFFGMQAAFYMDWPGGATIALVAGLTYVLTLLGKYGIKRARKTSLAIPSDK
ncbi:putative metal transport system membrane protein [Neochlamydia sp. TUME1]|uniref:metal ABC transporter permease n=1 Tax=unclassified Neochlamydia TaxID=2643326 RepID=UPI00057E3A47|nr:MULTISPECIES: metal ABC transporter permease [unclassified Neochlamydia]KIC74562.1 putative metal transport system membrane protein [Neochlamydia sp. TUME1]BBI16411.1 ABC-type transporter, permease subunit [Neochlamydia sp. S13]